MKADTIEQLDELFDNCPIMRAADVPTVQEVDAASKALDVSFPDDYREFILRYGGATVGPYPIFGLRAWELVDQHRWSVLDTTQEVRRVGVAEAAGWIVFSEDHAGNPIGLDANGKVWIYDHDFGGVSALAESFEEYLRVQCLKIVD